MLTRVFWYYWVNYVQHEIDVYKVLVRRNIDGNVFERERVNM